MLKVVGNIFTLAMPRTGPYSKACILTENLLDSIENDVMMLEERSVIMILDALRAIMATRPNVRIHKKASDLVRTINNIVNEMAMDN